MTGYLIAALLALLGAAGLMLRRRSGQVAQARRDAVRERVDGQAARNDAEAARLESGLKATEADYIRAAERGAAAGQEADAEVDVREGIARKYKAPCVILAACLAGAAAWAEPCRPDADAAGLLAALRDAGEVGADGAAMIESYQRERAALCERVGALEEQVSALAASRDALRGLRDIAAQDAATYREAWRDALERPPGPARRPILACLIGGIAGVSLAGEDTDAALGVGLSCGLTVLP